MAEIDDVRTAIERAADAGDQDAVVRLSARYRDLQARAGQLPRVGRLQPETGREFQLSQRVLQLRRAGREEDARQVIRVIARERFARGITRNGGGRGEAALFGANRGIFNLGTLVSGGRELLEDTLGGNRNNITAREHMEDFNAAQQIVRERHPVSAGAGEVGGVLLTIPAAEAAAARVAQGGRVVAPQLTARLTAVPRASVIGQEARAAQIAARGGRLGQVARGTARASVTGAAYGAVQGGSDAAVANEDVVQGAARGAEFGAVAGPVVEGGLRAAHGLARPVIERLMNTPLVQRLAERMQEPVADVVQRMNDFFIRTGRMPTAVEVLSQRSGREVSSMISGHGDAVETAIRRSEETQLARPRQMGEAIEQGRPRTAAGTVQADTSEEFTQLMRQVGHERVTLSDADLHLLNTRTARSVLAPEDRVLTDAGQRVQEGLSQRAAVAAAQANVQSAQKAAATAFAAAQRNPSNQSARRALDNAVRALRDARAREAAARRAVKPVHLTIREIETLRHDIGRAAKDGNTFALNELSDQIRDLARLRGGRPGQLYEFGLQKFAQDRSRAEGIEAGRAVVSNPTDEARAVARGEVTPRGESVPISQRQPRREGAEQGAISGLAERASQGPRGYRATAEDLATNSNLAGALDETVGVNESQRLQELGRVSREAADNLEAATPRRAEAVSEQIERAKRAWLGAAVIAQGSTGGAFRANFADKLSSILGVSDRAAQELAEMAFNPNRVGEFMNMLARASGNAQRFEERLTQLAGLLPQAAQRRWNDSLQHDAGQRDQPTVDGDSAPPVGDQQQEQPEEAMPISFNEVSPEYLRQLAQIESSGNANARARTSTAAGLYQFTERTWLEAIRRHARDVGMERLLRSLDDPSKRRALLALRHDPEISSRFAAATTAENFNALSEMLGRDPTNGELYAAHFLGLGGARRLLRAVESGVENAAEEFPREARANRSIFYEDGRPRSAQEVLDELESKWD